MQRVVVFCQEAVCGVRHLPGIVAHDEPLVGEHVCAAPHSGEHRLAHCGRVLLEQLLHKRAVRRLWELALLVEQRKEANRRVWRPRRQHGDASLIVWLVDGVPDDGLAQVDFLLLAEDAGVEVRLQHLVCKVDAQLLERVRLELLKAEDVKHADEGARVGLREQRLVDRPDEPVEELRVDGLGERVAGVVRLLCLERDFVHRAREGLHRARRQRLLERRRRQLHQPRRRVHRVGRRDGARLGVIRRVEADVAQVQQRREQRVDAALLLSADANGAHRGAHVCVRRLVVNRRDLDHAGTEVRVVLRRGQRQLRLVGGGEAGEELVEGMVVSLEGRLHHSARLFEQVGYDVGAH